jgi:hypothetical protein
MRLWTDFNYMEEEDRVWANLDQAEFYREDELRIGKKAELFDGLGYECMGTVVGIDLANRMVELELDRTTWRSADDSDRDKKFVASTEQLAYFA